MENNSNDPKWHEMPFKDLFVGILKRFLGLLNKLVGVKMFILYGATWMMIHPAVDFSVWAWMILALVVIFGREALKYIAEIRGK